MMINEDKELDAEVTPSGRPSSGYGVIWVVAVVTLGLFGGLTYGALRLGSTAVRDQVRQRVQTNAAVGATFVEDTLGVIEGISRSYAGDAEMVAAVGDGSVALIDTTSLAVTLGRLVRGREGIASGSVITIDGSVAITSPDSPELVGRNFSFRDWYRGARAADDVYVSEAYESALAAHPKVVAVVAPIRSSAGVTVAYLLITYKVDAVKSFVDQYDRQGIRFTVTDQRGTVVGAPGPTPETLVSQLDDPLVVAALAGESGRRDHTEDGQELVSAYVPVPGIGWTVRADVLATEAYASVTRLQQTILGLAAVLLVVLSAALVFLARSIRRRREAETRLWEAGRDLEMQRERLVLVVAAQQGIARAGLDIERVLLTVGQWALALTNGNGAVVQLPDGDELVYRSAVGDMAAAIGLRQRIAGSLPGECLQTGVPAVCSDSETDHRIDLELCRRLGVRSLIVVPLPAADGAAPAGVLAVTARSAHALGESDVAGLQVIAGVAGRALTEAAGFAALQSTEARYRTLVDHLPETAVMVYDADLRLQMAAGPGAITWRYAERNVLPGLLLEQIVSPAELAIVGPFYQSALAQPGTLEYYSEPTGLDFHFDAVPMTDAEGRTTGLLVMVRDVTRRKADEEALRSAEQRFRTAFEAAPVGMALVDLTGKFESVNHAFCELTGCTEEQIAATTIGAIIHPDEVDQVVDGHASMLDGVSGAFSAEVRLLDDRGNFVWVALSATLIRDGDGQPRHFLSHYVDITDRKQLDAQLRFLADHDPLTGLGNRRRFESELERHADQVARYGPAGALLVLDIDHFKQINDTLGHHAGDELIISLADVLRRRLRTTDAIARLGGDEFAVILPNANSEQAELVAGDLLQTIRAEVTVQSVSPAPHVTASIGIAMFGDCGPTGKDVLISADLAMYDAKEAGRDQYAFCRRATTP